ncbi:SLC45 family MFS transporter [Pseudanabaena sp. UWO311]|uniref:MFS transporter n=1 Tax=Pseudanabaena sp. UWO311 TaxID=2487337 RepID=UPI00115731A2|nr:MFS transporter [Pseudanabaena sp. UWO311]TYQ24336.1 SLC45 family MFS transporter [Pseudanabaena sp. UWO311]
MPTLLAALHNFNKEMNVVTDAQTNSFPNAPTKILWQQVWGLAALLAAITFSWIAYGFYQPRILARIGFVDLAIWLGIFQGLLGAIVEPIVGWFSDRILGRFGSRLPQVVVGVTLAGLIFVIASWLVETQLSEGMRWIVPVMMTMWVIAMIIFRGPAIALLQGFAPTNQLPQANAILALVLAITSATSPILGLILKQIGASMTFILGAIALLIGSVLLWVSMPRHLVTATSPEVSTTKLTTKSVVKYALPFVVGLGSGLEINLLLHILPRHLSQALDSFSVEYIQSGILLIAGVATLPLRSLFRRYKVTFGMGLGLAAIAGCLTLTVLSQNGVYLILISAIAAMALGLVLTNTIPLALAMVLPNQAGFGTGLYFGGNGMATAVVAALVVTQSEISSMNGALLCVFALAIALISLKKFADTIKN